MFEIIVCPIKKLYLLAAEGDMQEVAVIAVSSYRVEEEKLRSFQSALLLHFDDILHGKNAMRASDAARIAAFVKALPAETDTLFVCCDSGESRSSAIAAAILRSQCKNEESIWDSPRFHPNLRVYAMLCEQFNCPVTAGELEQKRRRSEAAFSGAIRAHAAERRENGGSDEE